MIEISQAVQWLRICASTAGSIPGGETKIPHAVQCGQTTPHKTKNQLNKKIKKLNPKKQKDFSSLFTVCSGKRASLVAQMVKCLPAMQETRVRFLVRKIPWRRKWQPTPVFWPGESHGQEPGSQQSQGCRESDMTEHTRMPSGVKDHVLDDTALHEEYLLPSMVLGPG